MAKQNAKIEKLTPKKAAEEAALREKILEEETEQDFSFDNIEHEEEEEELDEEEIIDDAVKAAAYDIFDEGDKLAKNGVPIKYWIKRNGSFIGEKYPPCTYAELQKEFGGGQYQVVAKEVATNHIRKSQVMSLTEIAKKAEDAQAATRIIREEPAAPAQPSFMELFTLMNQMSEKKSTEAQIAAQTKSSESNNMMLMMMEMTKSQAAQSQTMMLEIAKMQQQASKDQADIQAKMAEKMDARFEKIIDAIQSKEQNKEKPMSTIDLLSLINSSKTEGFELFAKMAEMADAKADERIAMIEDREDKSSDKPQSMTDKLIESVLPAIATSLAAQSSAPQAQPVRRAVARPALPSQTQRPVQSGQRAANTQNKAANQKGGQTQKAGNQSASRSGGSVGGGAAIENVKSASGLATVDFSTTSTPTESEAIATENPNQAANDEMIDILANTLSDCYLNQIDIKTSAARCINDLNAAGVSINTFLNKLSNDDMIKIVDTYGLPDSAKAWFNDLYANIKNSARVDLGGESNSN